VRRATQTGASRRCCAANALPRLLAEGDPPGRPWPGLSTAIANEEDKEGMVSHMDELTKGDAYEAPEPLSEPDPDAPPAVRAAGSCREIDAGGSGTLC